MSSYFVTGLHVEQLAEKIDEKWRLELPLVYYSETLRRSISVPKGFVTDFASVPRLPIMYWLAGGKANKAAVVHDFLYRQGSGVSRADADSVFVEAMEVTGQPAWRRALMWAGLRAGGMSSYQKLPLEWTGETA